MMSRLREIDDAMLFVLISAAMRTDGTYLKILSDWGVQKLAYPPLS